MLDCGVRIEAGSGVAAAAALRRERPAPAGAHP